MAVFEHVTKLHVAEAADGRVADVRGQRTAGVGIFEEVSDRVAQAHFVPDSDPHGGAFLAVDRLAAEVGLVEPHVEDVAFAQPVRDGGDWEELEPEEVKSRLIQYGQHLSEEDIDVAGALLDDGVEAQESQDPKEDRDENEHPEKRDDSGDEEVAHCASSRMTWPAFEKSERRTFRM